MARSTITALVRAGSLAVTCSVLFGCSHFSSGNRTADYPEAEQFPQIYQSKLMASAHWQLIAENEAAMLAERFEETPRLKLVSDDVDLSTSFGRAYENFFAAGLIDQGVQVFTAGEGLPVEYDVQVVRFADRHQRNYPPGFATGVGLSAFLLAYAADAGNAAAVLLPAAAGIDLYNYFNADSDTPDTEIILTTRVRSEDQLLYSHSSVYYMRAEDSELYGERRGFAVRGPSTL